MSQTYLESVYLQNTVDLIIGFVINLFLHILQLNSVYPSSLSVDRYKDKSTSTFVILKDSIHLLNVLVLPYIFGIPFLDD